MALMMPATGGGKEGSAFYFDGLRLCLINVGLSKPVYWPDGAVEWLARRVYQPERRDAKICPIAEKHYAG